MTNSIDTSTYGNDRSGKRGAARDYRGDSCGENLDWSRGLEDLRRQVGRSTNVTGPLLTKVIEREIIPRLFLTHCDLPGVARKPSGQTDPMATIDCEGFARLMLSSEPIDRIMEQVQALMDGGVTLQRIYLDLLAPIARRLGEFWEEDRCTFIDMTIALSRLHWVLREIGRRNGVGLERSAVKPRIFLVPVPGEQHTFGLLMIEEFFLHAGWEMACDKLATRESILQTVSSQSIDVIGVTVGCEEFIGPLQELIDRVRQVSLNRQAAVMVGGRLFKDKPDFAEKIRDATVVFDGVQAVETAETLISPPTRLETIEQPT